MISDSQLPSELPLELPLEIQISIDGNYTLTRGIIVSIASAFVNQISVALQLLQ